MSKLIAGILTICFSAFSFIAIGQSLVVTTGANIVVNGNPYLIIKDAGFNNSGTFNAGSGSVLFSGTANATVTSISGASTTSFYNLNFNKTSGLAKLAKNVSVTNTLLMSAGNLDLNGFDLDLGTTGNISGEGPASFITTTSSGSVVRMVNLNAPTALNPGNVGFEITSTANLGLTTIKRGHQQQVSASGFSIYRYYDIIPANNTGLNATVKFYYLDQELAGINESELEMWASADAGTSWTLLGFNAKDNTTNYVTKNNINQLNRLTLASSINNPLPIQLVSLTGTLVNNDVYLRWTTSSEINNHHFELQKSFDGRNFTSFANVTGAGNSTTISNYSFIDVKPFESGVIYYRLKQVNANGNFTYTKVIAVNKGKYTSAFVSAYPNPASGPLHVRFLSTDIVKAKLIITNIDGQVVATKEITSQKGLNDIVYDVSRFAQGTYYLKIYGIDDKVIKIIKN